MNGILIICEGKHDMAYLSLLLELLNFSEYKKNISDFDQPLKDLFINQIGKFDYDNNRLRKGPNLPVIFKQPNKHHQFAILYAIDGIRNIEKAKEVIFNYRTAIEFGEIDEKKKIDLSLCMIFDADDVGIEKRIEQMIEQYKDKIENIENAKHNIIIDENKFKCFGSYIIANNEGKGNLEDILIANLNRNSNQKEKIENASKYLKGFTFERTNGKPPIIDGRKTNSDFNKSLIALTGQFEFSGLDNGELIRKHSSLKGLLSGDAKSKEIISLLKGLLKKARD
ncbi:hypothetical protein JBL43_09100 [Aureibaculum sp. A20]|uniref:DUF4276 family protein n=1 Tax=Aureibaculum flavum TaxID=2795986 RepID=A0ABS0WQX9_9FLAO|nr:DUF3226 domain-containing protein [Aureibaculum flavum]MBJ2174392.1 hypothetical protein [Aureibaculum flavum]